MSLLNYSSFILLYLYFVILITNTSTDNTTTSCTTVQGIEEKNITDSNVSNRIIIPVFYTLESALEVLKNEQGMYKGAAMKVLDAFENKCPRDIPGKIRPRKPFIVIEGNHKTTRKIVARRLAKRLGATLTSHPPACLEHLSEVFARGTLIRKAFYALSLYVAARNTKKIYDRYPVVMNGYWLENAAYALSRAFRYEKLPKLGASIYKWPGDLLIPDLVFYVNFPDNLHYETYTTRSKENWKPKMLEAFKRITKPQVLIVSSAIGMKPMVNLIESEIKWRLQGMELD